jgi:tRNA(fMet)-specific endonuclease VapC
LRFLLDTNICIGLLHGTDSTLHKKMISRSPTEFVLCSVVKGELIYGARKSKKIEKNLRHLNTFFNQFVSLPFDDKAAEFYGFNRAILRELGKPIGENDLLISSIAIAHDLTIVTRNKDEFARVPALKMETW